ncbi:uncharacterized protein [Porites lutea]|uniref:uncharacterized protein isoform X2 n=1 Tax=Porites lutea TaxID=51062 RepID=UPI003CC6A394
MMEQPRLKSNCRSTFGLQQTRRENHKKRKSRYFGVSELLVVKNGVCPGPKKLPQSVNGNYGHSTQLGDGKGKPRTK